MKPTLSLTLLSMLVNQPSDSLSTL